MRDYRKLGFGARWKSDIEGLPSKGVQLSLRSTNADSRTGMAIFPAFSIHHPDGWSLLQKRSNLT